VSSKEKIPLSQGFIWVMWAGSATNFVSASLHRVSSGEQIVKLNW